jgi:hypothetical protein
MLAHARQEQAHSLVEEALEITDTVEPETAAIQKAKLQSDLRRWMAGHISREDWGADRVGATLNINVGGYTSMPCARLAASSRGIVAMSRR